MYIVVLFSQLRTVQYGFIFHLNSCSSQHIWSVRERMAEGLLHDGYCNKYDVSLPLANFYDLVVDMRDRVGQKATRVVGYGHVGDGRLY